MKQNLRTLPDMVTGMGSKVTHYMVFRIALRGGEKTPTVGSDFEHWNSFL